MPAIIEREKYSDSSNDESLQKSSRHVKNINHDVESGRPLLNFTFNSTSIRNAFIRKVFFLVSIMLLVTALITSIPFMNSDIRHFVQRSFGLYIISWLLFTVVYIALMCCEGIRRSYPTNLIFTALLTLSMSLLTMCICAYHDIISVLICLVITAICCFGIIIFALQTKYDLTSFLGILFICTLVVFVIGIVAMIAAWIFNVKWLYIIYAGLAAILFMAYLAVDIQLVMGGKKYEISPEEYIFAAITIFTDIVYLFWMILGLFGGIQNE
ncbi:unnamed protein product [Thelazia callipaeda]|uniref:Protein lifeguard 1 n=1 Tax=Thelazia callipaeda TaxID=103827 RepID=A0A0N5D666_THECL|nr:unnamed protein product [Thelazia callipaeda]